MKAANTPAGSMPGYRSHKAQVQGRGVQKMVDKDRYCIDVITQVGAVKAVLDAVALLLLEGRTEHCVVDAIQAGDGSTKVRELNEAVERLIKAR